MKNYGKERVIQKGNKIPNFALMNVNDKSAFNKYPQDKFEILSISMDQRLETVQQFTSQKHKLAWNNLWVPEARGGKFEKEFEVTGFPTTFLINKEGVIIETESLRGARLIETLGQYLD